MAYTLIAHASKHAPTLVTTSAINTTGSDLIVAVMQGYKGNISDASPFSDSASNTWTGLTSKTGATVSYVRMFYCHNPTTSATHTFTANNNANIAGGIYVTAWSGSATSPFDVQNGATNSSSLTIQPGSITPSAANALVITGMCNSDNMTGTPTVDGSYSVGTSPAMADPWVSGNYEGGGLGYWVQTSATATNPTWTNTGTASFDLSAVIASFLAAGGGGASSPGIFWRSQLEGIGGGGYFRGNRIQ